MMRQEVDEEDLRTEIYSLRKHIARVCSENQILKVKTRKLQDEMIKRDRQLDEFLHSKRFFGLSKNLPDKGASVLMNLKLKSEKQGQLLLEKDMTIKRLQNTLQTAKLYNANCFNKKFASKGVECTLLGDNKVDYNNKKGRTNTKLELHMPNFDTKDFDSTENIKKSRRDVTSKNGKRANSVESQFLLDINLDLKQSTKPSFYSESRYERASYHMETKASKSEGLLDTFSNEYIPIETGRSEANGHKRQTRHDFQKELESDGCTNPTFKKILRTIEELMAQGKRSDFNYCRTETIDESVQFPFEGPEMLRIIDSTSNDLTHETLIMTTIKSHSQNFDIGEILDNEQPPSILNEIQVQDQSDQEGISVNEKIDTMEKSEIRNEERTSMDKDEMTHEEIKQLHVYLLDMISQVDSLKDTISQMKAEQEKTDNDLKSKDESIGKLAKKIEELRELRSFSTVDIETLANQFKSSVEMPEKENAAAVSYVDMQKTTQQNIKKIAGKMKHLKETKSKSSVSSHTEKKTSRSSSKSSKPEKRKHSEKNHKNKADRKVLETSNAKKVFGIGNGDVEVPFYRCGFVTSSENKSTKNEFDELD